MLHLIFPGVLVPQVVDPQATARSLEGWINQHSRLLGAVRLRQVRVSTNSSCVPSALVAHLANRSASCWAAVTDAAVRTAPIYGVNLDGNGTRRVYRHSSLTNQLVINGAHSFARLRSYPTSGYQVDIPGSRIYADEVRRRSSLAASRLPPPASRLPGSYSPVYGPLLQPLLQPLYYDKAHPHNPSHRFKVLRQLEEDSFFGLETRSVTVQFTAANANINMICIVRLVFERLESGGLFPMITVHPLRLGRYDGSGGDGRRAADIFAVLFVCYFMLLEMWEMRRAVLTTKEGLWAYCKLPWSLFDWSNICIFWAVLGCRDQSNRAWEKLSAQVFDPLVYPEIDRLEDVSYVENNLMAMNALLVYAKLLKFFCHFERVETLRLTLLRAGRSLLLFQPLFLTLMLAYACAFFFSFGHDVHAFRGVGHALVSLFRFLRGDVDLPALINANPYLAVLLCLSFSLSAYTVLAAMFLAILTETYVRTRVLREKDDSPASIAALRDYAATKKEDVLVVYQDLEYCFGWLSKVSRLGFDTDTAAWQEAAVKPRPSPRARPSRKRAAERPPPAVAEEVEQDPDMWRERVIEQLGPEDAAVQRAAMMTDQLKAMYLKMCNGQQETMDLVERVAAAVSSVQHENALILNELQTKGIEFNLDVAAFARVDTEPEAPLPPSSPEPGASSPTRRRRSMSKRATDDSWDDALPSRTISTLCANANGDDAQGTATEPEDDMSV